jgi:type III pantothenate kinase
MKTKRGKGLLLVFDAGNTETVMGLFDGKKLVCHWRVSSRTPRTADEYFVLFQTWVLSAGYTVKDIRGVAAASVVPTQSDLLADMAVRYLGIEPYFITAESDSGLSIQYNPPQSVGADRIANAAAGFARFGGPLIIVDFGTATTFDVISESGDYQGGAITLGLYGIVHELHRQTAMLPKIDFASPLKVVGDDTRASIRSGVLWGTACLVEGMIGRIANEKGWISFRTVATGGLASLIQPMTPSLQSVEPNLTLDGIRMIYQRRQSNLTSRSKKWQSSRK